MSFPMCRFLSTCTTEQYIRDIHGGIKIELGTSGEASPTFGHANANFSVFIDRIRNQFLKE